MSTFAAAFREIVRPKLEKAARLQALSVVRGRCTFGEASACIIRMAGQRGAYSLPDDMFVGVQEWIATTIIKTIIDIETRPDAAREIVNETLGTAWPETI